MSEMPTPSSSNRIFRRKRRFQGASWTPPSVSAIKTDGIWCAFHRQRHGYKSSMLGAQYEKTSTDKWRLLWYCKETGTVLDQIEMGGES